MQKALGGVVDPGKGKLSSGCIRPEDAIYIEAGIAVIEQNRGTHDGVHIPACPDGAVRVVRADEQAGAAALRLSMHRWVKPVRS